ncbi:MAG: hypothetical protein EBY65_09735 [Acidimicrobiia bacterium]|nr:hypothetical protein [Acidimicrobiia bacterium]
MESTHTWLTPTSAAASSTWDTIASSSSSADGSSTSGVTAVARCTIDVAPANTDVRSSEARSTRFTSRPGRASTVALSTARTSIPSRSWTRRRTTRDPTAPAAPVTTIANDGQSEPNIDPADRIAVEQLIRVAELQVASLTELSTGPITVEVGNRSQWADRTITDYRPLFETLSDSMSQGLQLPDDLPTGDPMAAMMASLTQMMGPMMLGMTTGSMVGHLARRALGGFDLPVPRAADAPILVLLRNVDEFGDAWSLDRDDLRLWVCLHEVAHQTVFNVPHVRERLTELLQRHALL